MSRDELVRQIAKMKYYGDAEGDIAADSSGGEDAMETLNNLIRFAREIEEVSRDNNG